MLTERAGLPGQLISFVTELRNRNVNVGTGETVDAGRVLSVLDLSDREVVREGLACALIRSPMDRPVFDALFDLWFPPALGQRSSDVEMDLPDGDHRMEEIRDLIADYLVKDSPEIDPLISELVGEFGEYQSGSGGSGPNGSGGKSYSAYQTMQAISADQLLSRLIDGLSRPGDASAEFGNALAGRAAQAMVANFRKKVEEEARRRVAEVKGRDRVAKYSVPKKLDEVVFLNASEAELQQLQSSVSSLGRLLAARLAMRRRRGARGTIDLRHTLRKSLSTGGVPIDLVRKKPRISRPELVILCDVSGSVAGFSQFTMHLVGSLSRQFSKVRIFAFVDAIDEVTELFTADHAPSETLTRMMNEHEVVAWGNSDYGEVLKQFRRKFPDAVTARSSLMILGDARTNYRNPELDTLREMVKVAKHAYWLNPENRDWWGQGDSAALEYEKVIEMYECKSVKQLTAFVGDLLPAR